MITDGISLGYKTSSEKQNIARRLKDFDDKNLQKIVNGSEHTRIGNILRMFSRTYLRERMIAGDIIRFREEGRSQGCDEREISNTYGTLLAAGEIY